MARYLKTIWRTPVMAVVQAPSLDDLEDFVRKKVKAKWTHKQLSEHLQKKFPGVRGFSVRSIERFCSQQSIHKTARIDDSTLDQAVACAVEKVVILYLVDPFSLELEL